MRANTKASLSTFFNNKGDVIITLSAFIILQFLVTVLMFIGGHGYLYYRNELPKEVVSEQLNIDVWTALSADAPETGYDADYFLAIERTNRLNDIAEIAGMIPSGIGLGDAISAIGYTMGNIVLTSEDLKSDYDLAIKLLEQGKSDYLNSNEEEEQKRAAKIYVTGANLAIAWQSAENDIFDFIIGNGIQANFSNDTIEQHNITVSTNEMHKPSWKRYWQMDLPGGSNFTATFNLSVNVSEPGAYQIALTHGTAFKFIGSRLDGYSPITIKLNNNIVVENYNLMDHEGPLEKVREVENFYVDILDISSLVINGSNTLTVELNSNATYDYNIKSLLILDTTQLNLFDELSGQYNHIEFNQIQINGKEIDLNDRLNPCLYTSKVGDVVTINGQVFLPNGQPLFGGIALEINDGVGLYSGLVETDILGQFSYTTEILSKVDSKIFFVGEDISPAQIKFIQNLSEKHKAMPWIQLLLLDGQNEPAVTCGANVAPGVWKKFDCYNLGAIGKTTNDDPFTPSWRLNGGYWQWGRKGPDPSQWHNTNTSNFAHGPTGPDLADANSDSISEWDTTYAPDGSWSDASKTANDPCPDGYQVPTKSQWDGVLSNNAQSTVGSWSSSTTNYSSALSFGDNLLLPAAGIRRHDSGSLYYRGTLGLYWGNNHYAGADVYNAWALYFVDNPINVFSNRQRRRLGLPVRCIAE